MITWNFAGCDFW